MKIGIVTEHYYPNLGGITEHCHHLYLALKNLGHEPVLITSDAGLEKDVDLREMDIIRVGKSIPIYQQGAIGRVTLGSSLGRRIREILKSEQFDILHMHSPVIPVLPMLFQRYANTLTVGTFHTVKFGGLFLKLTRTIIQKYIDRLDGKIAVSKACCQSMAPLFRGDFTVIPNGVDPHHYTQEGDKISQWDDGKTNIFFMARLEPRSGLEYLIKAFALIRQPRNDCRLIIAGEGPLGAYYRSLVPSHLKNDCIFVGLANKERPFYYRTADIFCLPTSTSSFSITLLEAMATAKPVVAFSLPCFEEIAVNNKEILLSGPPSVLGLVTSLTRLLDNPFERLQIGKEARKKAITYSWNRVTEKILHYYSTVSHPNQANQANQEEPYPLSSGTMGP